MFLKDDGQTYSKFERVHVKSGFLKVKMVEKPWRSEAENNIMLQGMARVPKEDVPYQYEKNNSTQEGVTAADSDHLFRTFR